MNVSLISLVVIQRSLLSSISRPFALQGDYGLLFLDTPVDHEP